MFASVWFCLLGVNWIVLIMLALHYLRPHPLVTGDKVIGGIGVLMGLFYFWVAAAVYMRQRYIWNVALACAGFSILSFPFGTILALMLLSSLFSAKEDFMR